MSRVIEVRVNCPSRAVAETIAAAAVRQRVAACSNIHPEVDSSYHWQGGIETARETPLVLKTRTEHYEALVALVERLHPYATPGVLGREVDLVNEAYREWVARETGGAQRPREE